MQKHKKLREFTFPDSGKTCYFPPVSIGAAAMRLRRRYKAPKPPLQEVDFGGRKEREYNYSHPDYKLTLLDYERFIETESAEIAIAGLYNIQLNQDQKAEIDAWKEENPESWDGMDTDAALWLENVGIESEADFMALLEYVGGAAPERIEALQSAFPD